MAEIVASSDFESWEEGLEKFKLAYEMVSEMQAQQQKQNLDYMKNMSKVVLDHRRQMIEMNLLSEEESEEE